MINKAKICANLTDVMLHHRSDSACPAAGAPGLRGIITMPATAKAGNFYIGPSGLKLIRYMEPSY